MDTCIGTTSRPYLRICYLGRESDSTSGIWYGVNLYTKKACYHEFASTSLWKMQKMETKKVGMSTQMSRKRSDFSLLIKVKVMILNSQTKNAHIQLYHLYT